MQYILVSQIETHEHKMFNPSRHLFSFAMQFDFKRRSHFSTNFNLSIASGSETEGCRDGLVFFKTEEAIVTIALCVCCRKRFYKAGLFPWSTCTSIIRNRARTSARSTSVSSMTSRTARLFCASYRLVYRSFRCTQLDALELASPKLTHQPFILLLSLFARVGCIRSEHCYDRASIKLIIIIIIIVKRREEERIILCRGYRLYWYIKYKDT